MKSFKILILAAVAIVAGIFTACSDSDFKPGPKVDGAQVYFPETIASVMSISDDVTSIAIPVKRINTTESLNVPILAQDPSGLFTIPSSVSFAAGAETSNLLLTFDRTALVDGSAYPLSFIINDEDNTTPYGNRTLELTVEPWPWEEMGTGKYRDDWMSNFFNPSYVEIDVTTYKHKSRPGIYMVEEMLGWPFLTEFFGATQAQLSGQFSYTPTNITINASDPNAVVIAGQYSGITENTYGYGDFWIGSRTGYVGTLVNGVITFPKDGLIVQATGQGSYAANGAGMFRIVLGGYEALDYSLAAEYEGMKVDATGTITSAVINFTYGADVTGISYVFVGGDVTGSADDIADEIIDGTIDPDNVYSVANFTVGGGQVSTQTEFEDAGTYTVIALPKDKDGELVAAEVFAVKFYFPGLGNPPSPLMLDYTKEDITGLAKSAYFQTWDLWAVDYYGDSSDRINLGQIVISENTVDDDDDFDAVNIKGLTLGAIADDTIVWEYYGGVIYSLAGVSNPFGSFVFQGRTLYLGYSVVDKTTTGSAANDYLMFAGQVEEGYLAFVSNNASYDFNGLFITAYSDPAMTERVGAWECYYKMMLVDPSVEIQSASLGVTTSGLKALARNASVRPENFVELRGRERAHALIDELIGSKNTYDTRTRTLSVKTGVCEPLPKQTEGNFQIKKGAQKLVN